MQLNYMELPYLALGHAAYVELGAGVSVLCDCEAVLVCSLLDPIHNQPFAIYIHYHIYSKNIAR